jgi:glycosyltransferase involved in cell wall biosynthesis
MEAQVRMPSGSPIVEVRIPTYNRPTFLRRALDALLSQTYENWCAVVLDDGDATRTQQIVSEIGDGRISHSPNRERLGGARNIVRAFSRQPMVGGEFFYVLEDDNLILPKFIEQNLGWLSTYDVGLVVNNQWVEVPSGDPPAASPAHDVWTTIDCFTEGVWSADDFKIALLWRNPMSNGSIFWRLNCRSDFTLDDKHHPGIHEELRAYRLDDAIYFNETPNAYWYPSIQMPSSISSSIAGMSVYLRRERAVQIMRRHILSRLRRRGESEKLLSKRYKTPLPVREEGVLKAYGRWPAPSGLTFARRAELLAKALLLRGIVPDVPLR